jgi:hypothetical protein
MLCPVGCSSTSTRALLLGLYETQTPTAGSQAQLRGLEQRQQEQLLLIARRLGELLEQR